MKRFIKYGVVPVVTFLFLLVATVIVLPVIINVQKFIPEIEEKLSDVTGRSISIGSNFGLSFFPWLSLSFSDLKIDNPEGYLSDGFIKIESFEARLKLLPLLKKEVEISRCIIGGLEVNLETRDDGKVNWDFTRDTSDQKIIAAPSSPMANLSLPDGLSIVLFAITDGTVAWVDNTRNSRHNIEDLLLVLNDVTWNDPVTVEFKASLEGKSLAAEGTLGPFGEKSEQGGVPVELAISLNNTFSGEVKGKILNLHENLDYDLDLLMPPFPARELFSSLDIDFPYIPADPNAFQAVSVDVTAKGDKEKVSIEKGTIKIDDSLFNISLVVNDLEHPHLGFALDIDSLDLDRYLPSGAAQNNEQDSLVESGQGVKDYRPWRKVNLAGTIQMKELRVGGGTANDINARLRAAEGIFAVNPSSFNLYQGRAETTLTVDFQGETPQTNIDVKVQGVQTLPFLHDFLEEDFLRGTLDANVRLLFSGKSAEALKTSLYADGTLILKDGALEGIDMVSALRKTAALPSVSDPSIRKKSTDISELKSTFTIRNGLIGIRQTTLDSPLASFSVSGTADLSSEQLDMLITPKVVGVLTEEQRNKKDTSGSKTFAISGTFAEPKIDIEAQYLSLDLLNLSDEAGTQSLVNEKLPSPVDEDVKDLVGTSLVDPVVVAERFGLEPRIIRKDQVKKQPSLGTGKIRISPLQEEESWPRRAAVSE